MDWVLAKRQEGDHSAWVGFEDMRAEGEVDDGERLAEKGKRLAELRERIFKGYRDAQMNADRARCEDREKRRKWDELRAENTDCCRRMWCRRRGR